VVKPAPLCLGWQAPVSRPLCSHRARSSAGFHHGQQKDPWPTVRSVPLTLPFCRNAIFVLRVTVKETRAAHVVCGMSVVGYGPPLAANEAMSAIRSRTGRVEAGARTPEPASVGLTHSSPAGSRLWHVMGLQRSVQESAILRAGCGRCARNRHRASRSKRSACWRHTLGPRRPSERAASPCKSSPSGWPSARRPSEEVANDLP
jgi:hypothetical protein